MDENVYRLKLSGCTSPSFTCIKRVVEEFDAGEILDYFIEIGAAKFAPLHPALDVVEKEVELVREGDDVIGVRIRIVATDGEKNYEFKTSCISGEAGDIICYPSPLEHSASTTP